jgi:Zn-dependent oligopeptidase
MDMALHSQEFKGNSYDVAYNLCNDILGSNLSEHNLYLNVLDRIGGYDVKVYSYLYSQVIALELLSVFEGRELDPELGKRFRDEVLSQGAVRPSYESVVKFLGHEPSMIVMPRQWHIADKYPPFTPRQMTFDDDEEDFTRWLDSSDDED